VVINKNPQALGCSRREVGIGAVKTAREGGNKSSIARLKRPSRQGGQKKVAGDAGRVRTVTWVNAVHATTTLQWGSLLLGRSEKNMERTWHEQELELVHPCGSFSSSFLIFPLHFHLFFLYFPTK
jgi:hypothetical protein